MGTRGLTMVVSGGEYKVSQYGQWDHYPDGHGVEILEFLRNAENISDLREKLNYIHYPDDGEIKDYWRAVGHDPDDSPWVNYAVSIEFERKYPSLHRDNGGARILRLITHATANNKIPIVLDKGFAYDSLFCEWAYLIDLDNNTFEIYKGFNTEATPDDSRFPSSNKEKSGNSIADEYEPIRLVRAYSFDELPSEEEFLSDLDPEDED